MRSSPAAKAPNVSQSQTNTSAIRTVESATRHWADPKASESSGLFPRNIAPHLIALRVLGEGGTAIVYEALHLRLNVTVAVKVLRKTGASVNAAAARLLREAELCAHLDSPRVPRVYDVDAFADGTPYVVMDIVRGRSLEQILEHGPLDVDVACAITSEVLRAVGDLHEAKIVHRDIKPSNLMVEDHPRHGLRVRVLDLGIARTLPEPSDPWEANLRLTQEGMLLGTPHYMASEQLSGSTFDQRTDIYAIGVMLYEMLSGTTPFDGQSASDILKAAMRETPKPLTEIRPEVPYCLQSIVMRAMARDPELRYRSTEDMLQAIRDFHANENTCRLTLNEADQTGRLGERRTPSPLRTRQPSAAAFSAGAFAPLLLLAALGGAAFPSRTHEETTMAPLVMPLAHARATHDMAILPPDVPALAFPEFALSTRGTISLPEQPEASFDDLSAGPKDGLTRRGERLYPRSERRRAGREDREAQTSATAREATTLGQTVAELTPPMASTSIAPVVVDSGAVPGIPLNPYIDQLDALLSPEEDVQGVSPLPSASEHQVEL